MPMSPRLLRPRATGFDPRSIANLAVWFDANDATTITTVSGAVSQWNSKVAGITATQTTANNRPAYSATSFNGKAGVSFDGSNDQLDSTYNANLLTNYVAYAAVVLPAQSMVDTKANFEPLWFARNSSANGLHVNTSSIPKRWTMSWRSALFNSSVGPAVQNAAQIVLTTINATTMTVRVNGVQGTASGTFAAGSNETSANFQLGRDGSSARYFDGIAAELLMWSRTLTAAELVQVERYLARKWGVTLA